MFMQKETGMLPLFRLEPYWEVSPGNTPYMDLKGRTKNKKAAAIWTQQPQALLLAGALRRLLELGTQRSHKGPACWDGALGTAAIEEAEEKLRQFCDIL